MNVNVDKVITPHDAVQVIARALRGQLHRLAAALSPDQRTTLAADVEAGARDAAMALTATAVVEVEEGTLFRNAPTEEVYVVAQNDFAKAVYEDGVEAEHACRVGALDGQHWHRLRVKLYRRSP